MPLGDLEKDLAQLDRTCEKVKDYVDQFVGLLRMTGAVLPRFPVIANLTKLSICLSRPSGNTTQLGTIALAHYRQKSAEDRISGRMLVERNTNIPIARCHACLEIADAGHVHNPRRAWNQGNSCTRTHEVKSGKDLANLERDLWRKTRSATSPNYVVVQTR
jgi:hypothetical protein